MSTSLHVHIADPGGEIDPTFRSYSLADFGGCAPGIGDCIVPPDQGETDEFVIWEVIGRLHQPGAPFDTAACVRLVVRPRTPTAGERALFE